MYILEEQFSIHTIGSLQIPLYSLLSASSYMLIVPRI